MYSPLDEQVFECHWYFSKYLLGLFLILYSLSLVVVITLPFVVSMKVLLIILLSAYVARGLLKHVLFRLPSSFTALRKTSKKWFIYSSTTGWQLIQLSLDSCLVLSGVIILQFRFVDSKRNQTICLPCDGLQANDLRKLKIYLRLDKS